MAPRSPAGASGFSADAAESAASIAVRPEPGSPTIAITRAVLACSRSSTRPTSRSRCRTGVRGDSSGRSSQPDSSAVMRTAGSGEPAVGSAASPYSRAEGIASPCAPAPAPRAFSSAAARDCPSGARPVRRSAEGPGPVSARSTRALTLPGSWPIRRKASVPEPATRRTARRRWRDEVWRAPTLWAMLWASHSSPASSRFVSQCNLGATASIFAAPMPRSPSKRAAAPPARRRPSNTSSEAAVRPSALAKARASASAPGVVGTDRQRRHQPPWGWLVGAQAGQGSPA